MRKGGRGAEGAGGKGRDMEVRKREWQGGRN